MCGGTSTRDAEPYPHHASVGSVAHPVRVCSLHSEHVRTDCGGSHLCKPTRIEPQQHGKFCAPLHFVQHHPNSGCHVISIRRCVHVTGVRRISQTQAIIQSVFDSFTTALCNNDSPQYNQGLPKNRSQNNLSTPAQRCTRVHMGCSKLRLKVHGCCAHHVNCCSQL